VIFLKEPKKGKLLFREDNCGRLLFHPSVICRFNEKANYPVVLHIYVPRCEKNYCILVMIFY